MAKIELVNYTDRIGNPLYYVRIDGRQVEESETPDYAQAIRFYNYAVNNGGKESYEVVKFEQVVRDEIDAPVADETYDWDSPSFVAKVEEESKLWAEWSSRPNWAATQSFQDFVNKKIEEEKEEYERTRNSGHSGSGEEKGFKYTDMSFGAMANRMNDKEFLIFVSDCYKAKTRGKLGEYLSEFVDQFFFKDKSVHDASTNALCKTVLNSEQPF